MCHSLSLKLQTCAEQGIILLLYGPLRVPPRGHFGKESPGTGSQGPARLEQSLNRPEGAFSESSRGYRSIDLSLSHPVRFTRLVGVMVEGLRDPLRF